MLNDLTKSEFLSVSQLLGLSAAASLSLYEACGPSLEAVLQARGLPDPAAYPHAQQEKLRKEIEAGLQGNLELKEGLQRALSSVTSLKPYGDVFTESEVAAFLAGLNLMVQYPANSSRFRDKASITALRAVLAAP